MKFAHAVVACLLAQAVSGAPVEKEERKLQYGHGYHQGGSGYNYYPPLRTHVPTPRPTPRPTPIPTDRPTPIPTSSPSSRPTPRPTPLPTPMPTHYPTGSPPTKRPTPFPTELERTHRPTSPPTMHPTRIPTPEPTPEPTPAPSAEPSPEPSPEPSAAPSPEPSSEPSETPSEDPTSSEEPSESPTASEEPSESPTISEEPTAPDLDTIAGIICDPDNSDILGNFCTLIRFTGVGFFLNDFEPLQGVYDDFFDFVQNSPFFPNRRLAEENNNERALLSSERDLQVTYILPQNPFAQDNQLPFIGVDEFVALVEQIYPGYLVDNPLDTSEFDDWVEDFRKALPASRQVFTVFAPTNDAFSSMGVDTEEIIAAAVASGGDNIVLDIVENHIIPARELLFSQLRCGRQYGMINGEFTRTECTMADKDQIGNGNRAVNGFPTIIRGLRNTQASNGVIQVVDEVILPLAVGPPTNEPSSEPSAAPTLSSAPSLSSQPSASPMM